MRPEEVTFPLSTDLDATISDAHAIVILTSHQEYKGIDLQELKKMMKKDNCIIIDGRKTIDPDKIKDSEIIYRGIGRGKHNNPK